MKLLTGRRDDGAIAVLSALLALVLFSIAALAVDLGNMQARKRITQSAGDLAALAGAQGLPDVQKARDAALAYLMKNPVAGESYATCPACYSDNDGPDYANGEIIVWNSAGGQVTSGTDGRKIRVIVPRRTVDFGLAGVMGFTSSTVHAAATATVGSPAKGKILPFGVAGGNGGLYCIHDNTPGRNTVLRSALLANPAITLATNPPTTPTTVSTAGGDTVTVTGTGTNFKKGKSNVYYNGALAVAASVTSLTSATFVTPPGAAGSVQVTVVTASVPETAGPATLTYATPPGPPPPTVTSVSPSSGNPGDIVTVTGTGFSPGTISVAFGGNLATSVTRDPATPATKLTAVAPAGSGPVDVFVTVNGVQSAPSQPADVFTYLVDPCVSATGNFGYLDLKGYPNPQALEQNIILGARYIPGIFPKPLPPVNTQCLIGSTPIPRAIIDNGTDNGYNCADVQNGNTVSTATTALLDGINNPNLGARLKCGEIAWKNCPPPDPCQMGTVKTRTNIETDSLQAFLTVPLGTWDPNATPVAGVIKKEIYDCPRFFLVPTLDIDGNQANGFYPITGFMGTFLESFETNNNGTKVTAIKAYVFSLDWIASPGPGGGTIPYLGSGPRIPILVHDAYDLPH